MENKEYSWAWVTASRLLTAKECELVYAHLVPSGAETGTILYDGESASGGIITYLVSTTVDGREFKPPVPIFCRRGLYLTVGTATTGVLVIWHNL